MKKGFTLIELLVVVLIIGILSSVALPQYTKAVEKSRATEAITLMGNLATGEKVYQMSTGNYTTDLSLLDVQLPGVTGTTNTITTKNFVFTVVKGDGTATIATAKRANNGTALAAANTYYINMRLDSDGTMSRWCSASAATNSSTVPTANLGTSAAEALCKSIANGDAKGLIK